MGGCTGLLADEDSVVWDALRVQGVKLALESGHDRPVLVAFGGGSPVKHVSEALRAAEPQGMRAE